MDLEYADVKALENLWHTFDTAVKRGRRILPIHRDEFQKYADVLKKVLDHCA